MRNCFRIIIFIFGVLGVYSCHSKSEEYKDILREGTWYVYDIDYSYKLYDKYETPELINFFHYLLEEENLLFIPGDELVFSKNRVNVKCPNGDVFRYSYYYSGDYLKIGDDREYTAVKPYGDMDDLTLSFDEQALEDLLYDLAPTDEYYAYLLDAVENNLREFHITYYLQRPVPEVAQIMSGIFVGPMYDGNQQLMNEAATVNLFWDKKQMNLTLDDKVILEDASGRGPQFYVEIQNLQIGSGSTPGSYLFTGVQTFTDAIYGRVDIRIINGRYNAAGTITVELEITWNESVYVLDLQKGVRQWDFQTLKAKSSSQEIILKK